MKRLLYFVFFIPSIFFIQSTYAWNSVGHMVIADVAYHNLRPNVKHKVDDLVGYFQKEYPGMNAFIHLAYWPDMIRGQRIETFNHWHYIDVPFSQDGTPIKNIIDTDNAVYILKSIKSVIRNPNANGYERARFLAFLIHIIGDMHQPLHTVSRISAQNPNGDMGGNLFSLYYENRQVKLHQLWDDGLGIFKGDATDARVHEISKRIMNLYSPYYFGSKVKNISPDDWAKEGMRNAKDYVYSTSENQTPSPQYIAKGKQFIEQEAALAGYRAAEFLNDLLG